MTKPKRELSNDDDAFRYKFYISESSSYYEYDQGLLFWEKPSGLRWRRDLSGRMDGRVGGVQTFSEINNKELCRILPTSEGG